MTILDDIYDYSVCWQMSPHERASILLLMKRLPVASAAIEIGCYTGGFLRQLNKHFKEVISVDLDHKSIDKTHPDFKGVEWFTGKSREQLPIAIESAKSPVSFILIDGDHMYKGVQSDLGQSLSFTPKVEQIILVHDSWYYPSRSAILDFPFNDDPYTHFVDLDFCTGTYANGNWVGGLALIHRLPTPRKGAVEVRESDELTYKRVTK